MIIACASKSKTTHIKDTLWDATPELGAEGLIATVDDPSEFLEALRRNLEQNKHKKLQGAINFCR